MPNVDKTEAKHIAEPACEPLTAKEWADLGLELRALAEACREQAESVAHSRAKPPKEAKTLAAAYGVGREGKAQLQRIRKFIDRRNKLKEEEAERTHGRVLRLIPLFERLERLSRH
jgi:hypothetical protein